MSEARERPRVVYIATVPWSVITLLRGQLRFMREHGFEVTVVCSPGEELETLAASERVEVLTAPMQREIRPFHDIVSLWRLTSILRKLKPDVVNASTPKAGLLGMLAARLVRVPVRVYTLRGLRLETVKGPKRFVLLFAERVCASCASRVVCVSESLRRMALDLGLATAAKTVVLGEGSSNGVEVGRFTATGELLERSRALRAGLGIPPQAPVIGFVGRLTRDKGIMELLDAYEEVSKEFPEARLLLLGLFEEGDPVPPAYARRLKAHPGVVLAGFAPDTAPYFHLMDVLAFPSHREGFPNVVLEAAVAGVPAVGFRTTGVVDAVVDRVTGILVSREDSDALAKALAGLLEDGGLRRRLGAAARSRAAQRFSSGRIWREWLDLYGRELDVRG